MFNNLRMCLALELMPLVMHILPNTREENHYIKALSNAAKEITQWPK